MQPTFWLYSFPVGDHVKDKKGDPVGPPLFVVRHSGLFINYPFSAALAAARRAIGTLNGLHET